MTAPLLKMEDIAERLQVSRRTIYNYIYTDSIPPPLKFGNCVRWHADDIERWIESAPRLKPDRFRNQK